MDINRYRELASKWLDGTINEAEKKELSEWYNNHSDEELHVPVTFAKDESELRERILSKVKESIALEETIEKVRYPFIKIGIVAASLVLFLLVGIGYYTWIRPDLGEIHIVNMDDVRPGGNKARLILADGNVIDLDDQHAGLVVGEELKYIDGTALFAEVEGKLPEDVNYATLSTPKGGQYQLNLPDGTQVWLNSASSIRFPSRFDTHRREVELLAGEAFFEVAKYSVRGKKVPFFVKSQQQMVEVLGTQFNINTYEAQYGSVTTVTEGSVAVRSWDQSQKRVEERVVLTAGHQSIVNKTGIKNIQVNVEEYVAWKDGYFYFNDADIYAVMKQFERWYDIEVTYEISRSDDQFYGKIPRDVSLGKALNVLKTAGVNFDLKDGRNLTVKREKK